MSEANDIPLVTHEVFFFVGDTQIGPMEVLVAEDREDDADMLEAAAVAHNAVTQWELKVKRLSDGHEETIDPTSASDWWA